MTKLELALLTHVSRSDARRSQIKFHGDPNPVSSLGSGAINPVWRPELDTLGAFGLHDASMVTENQFRHSFQAP
ncbi:hypothetical protein HUG15_14990 [Salicibibacter cibarius]|uniref:Uncharacterized protein n=1 Tax=Salicibibacter cibarius TaxID=2743000 RepID=A0A7T7CC85_9BACI|nr:hypothetical protein [Salicibibacter cibarius]QQK76739.1 hypothetical protein HUG15_14990 [Salicibibacter cibarius]